MRRTLLASLTLLTLFSLASAQEATLSIAFVQSAEVLAAHPAGQAAGQLREQARTELEEIASNLQPLVIKRNSGQQLTPEEQNELELSERTYQETQERYQQELATASQPAEEEIDGIIRQLAAENGYSLILDYDVARTSGLVIYADEGVANITEEVIAAIQAANPGAASGGGN